MGAASRRAQNVPEFGENYSAGLAMTAQAMRGGAALVASLATAWITMAVPPLLKTEWLSEPSVTFGATTVAWAVPSARTIGEKSGMSPAGSPPWSWAAPSGLKCEPADLKSGPSHLANWWM